MSVGKLGRGGQRLLHSVREQAQFPFLLIPLFVLAGITAAGQFVRVHCSAGTSSLARSRRSSWLGSGNRYLAAGSSGAHSPRYSRHVSLAVDGSSAAAGGYGRRRSAGTRPKTAGWRKHACQSGERGCGDSP